MRSRRYPRFGLEFGLENTGCRQMSLNILGLKIQKIFNHDNGL
jgi:hypothetical protein